MKSFKIILVICIFVINGCTFRDKLWGAKIDDEVAQDLLISEDGSKIVVLGKKYDYFLKDDKKIIQSFVEWEGKSNLVFTVDSIRAKGDVVQVRIIPEVDSKTLSEKQIKFLFDTYKRTHWDINKKMLILPVTDSSGSRFLAGFKRSEFKSNFASTGFIKSPHQTIVIEDPTKMQKTGKVFLTPFAIAADIVLLPITLPLFVYQQVKESQTPHFCQGKFCGYDKLKSDNNSKKNSNK